MRTLRERLLSKVKINERSGCHEWSGAKFSTGYGQLKVDGVPKYAHRLSFELNKGPIPKGTNVSQRCNDRSCVNPDHLFLGTADRLLAKSNIDPETGCWNWTANSVRGYGRIQVDGKKLGAHRASYEIHRGPIPDGLLVCHRCDNPRCINPEHLFLGTSADNAADKVAKGRQSRTNGAIKARTLLLG